jgi:hypothetical protein
LSQNPARLRAISRLNARHIRCTVVPAVASVFMMWRRGRLVGAIAAALGLWACECPPPTDEIFLLRAPDGATQTLIDRCLQPDLEDCLPLCAKVSGASEGSIVHCEIHPQTDVSFVQVHVGLQVMCPGGD